MLNKPTQKISLWQKWQNDTPWMKLWNTLYSLSSMSYLLFSCILCLERSHLPFYDPAIWRHPCDKGIKPVDNHVYGAEADSLISCQTFRQGYSPGCWLSLPLWEALRLNCWYNMILFSQKLVKTYVHCFISPLFEITSYVAIHK